MKITHFSKLLLLALVLSVAVTACKKTPKSPTPIFGAAKPVPRANTDADNPLSSPNMPKVPSDETSGARIPANVDGTIRATDRDDLSNYLQDRETFKQQTVYFEFDHYNVRSDELPKLQAVASYLKSNPNEKVLVEGHCDERGTPGYNMALGERRALSARESLSSLGLAADRIHTISFGEERPADPGHSENAYKKNRRAEFVLLRPKSAPTSASTNPNQ